MSATCTCRREARPASPKRTCDACLAVSEAYASLLSVGRSLDASARGTKEHDRAEIALARATAAYDRAWDAAYGDCR
jgi:hypothetical protein